MKTPRINEVIYWNNRGEVLQVTRRNGFVNSKRDDRVLVQFGDNLHEARVDDLYETEKEALQDARVFAHRMIINLTERIAAL